MDAMTIFMLVAVVALIAGLVYRNYSVAGKVKKAEVEFKLEAERNRLNSLGIKQLNASQIRAQFIFAIITFTAIISFISLPVLAGMLYMSPETVFISIAIGFVVSAFVALIAALIAGAAQRKGKSWVAFFWLSFLVSPILMAIIVAVIPSVEGVTRSSSAASTNSAPQVQCKFCKENIRADAVVCKHCGRDVEPDLEAIEAANAILVESSSESWEEQKKQIIAEAEIKKLEFRKSRSFKFWIVGGIAAGIGVALLVYVAFLPTIKSQQLSSYKPANGSEMVTHWTQALKACGVKTNAIGPTKQTDLEGNPIDGYYLDGTSSSWEIVIEGPGEGDSGWLYLPDETPDDELECLTQKLFGVSFSSIESGGNSYFGDQFSVTDNGNNSAYFSWN